MKTGIDWEVVKKFVQDTKPQMMVVSIADWKELERMEAIELIPNPKHPEISLSAVWGALLYVSEKIKPGIISFKYPEKQ